MFKLNIRGVGYLFYLVIAIISVLLFLSLLFFDKDEGLESQESVSNSVQVTESSVPSSNPIYTYQTASIKEYSEASPGDVFFVDVPVILDRNYEITSFDLEDSLLTIDLEYEGCGGEVFTAYIPRQSVDNLQSKDIYLDYNVGQQACSQSKDITLTFDLKTATYIQRLS